MSSIGTEMLSLCKCPGRALARQLLPASLLLGFALVALGADASGGVAQKLKAIPACPALVAAANLRHIPLEEIGVISGTNGLQPGDSATVLVTFVQAKKQTQWLLYLEATPPDPSKPAAKPSKFVVSSSFGSPMEFVSRPTPVKLRMFGPFVAAGSSKQPKSEEKEARFLLNEDFLGLGLDQTAALMYRWSQTTNFDQAVTSKTLVAMKPTPAEQRALCATFPALMSYFNIVQSTEGLEDLLRKLIESPSLWSLIRHGGVHVDLSFGNGLAASPADPADWNVPVSAPVYYFPWLLRLNDKPALTITLVTTRPRPPLLICGGVVGLLAEKIGDEHTYMTLRVVSAKCKADHQE